MQPKNVLYFTGFPIHSPNNGGSICMLSHIEQISQDPRINLFVVSVGTSDLEEVTKARLNLFDLTYYFIPFNTSGYSWHSWSKIEKIVNLPRIICPFMHEFGTFNQEHIAQKILKICEENDIKVIVVEYLYSFLLLPIASNIKSKIIYVTQNREAELYKTSLKRSQAPLFILDRLRKWISYLRLINFENKVNISVDKYIALTEADIPKYLHRKGNAAVVPARLNVKPSLWQYTRSKTIFFIGSSDHYPNYLAINWLLCELAPLLLKMNPDIKVVIAGKMPAQIPDSWRIENTDLLGFISQEEVANLFKTCDLFICPVKNDYGVKIKALECVSYGTPLFATVNTLKGLPYLHEMPVLDLDSPSEAANFICDALYSPGMLEFYSKKILESASEFDLTEKDRWYKILFG
jgi:hypothetical protein